MSTEFTGERVIPGEVDVDLWNEHLSRYAFAARLARRKRVLDIGSGTGYGSAELANTAVAVTGIDVSGDATAYASEHYSRHNLTFQQASATALPFADGSFDLVVAFEVIEHLSDWADLLREARRVLAPGGQFVVSTPNKSYYAESRRNSGPNPFHEHEFEFEEFRQALETEFPHTLLFTQNHTASIVFRPASEGRPQTTDTRMDGEAANADEAHFFIAVCAAERMTGGPAFLYVPTAGNVLRERERHIQRLEAELSEKDTWLQTSQREHAALVTLHEEQTKELKARNEWAMDLNARLEAAGNRVFDLQRELAEHQASAMETVRNYEAAIARLEEELQAVQEWGKNQELEAQNGRLELQQAVELLHAAEATVEERTLWAQALDKEIQECHQQLNSIRASKWIRLGRSIGLGPRVE